MNLDNYFARYLSKKSRPAVPIPMTEAMTSYKITVNDTKIASGPEAVTSPSPPQPTGTPPLDASPHEVIMTLMDDDIERENVAQPGKRARNEVSEGSALPAKAAAKSFLTVPRREVSDEDELDMLLGREKAQEVKLVDALARDGTTVSSLTLLTRGNGERGPVSAETATASRLGSLPWRTASNRAREAFATFFDLQFQFELHCSTELLSCFRPFFKDKTLARIERGTDLRPIFFPAPKIPAAPMAALSGCVLRDYQVAGVQFLLDKFHRGMSCILSDDMGLGKTAQIACFLHTLKTVDSIDGPHLIVAPLSTLTSWTRELARWAPGLKVFKYHGERRARQQSRNNPLYRHAVMVTTPAVLNQDRSLFRKRAWVVVIVDEAHVLKGHNTNVSSISRKLQACFRIAVTGTPVHNNAREVWSLLSFLYPSLTAGYDNGTVDSVEAAEDCARLLHHIMLRRTKDSMELGIPPRVDEPLVLLEPTYVQSQILSSLTDRALEDDCGRQMQCHLSHQRAVCNHPMMLLLLAAEKKCSASASLEERMRVGGVEANEQTLIAPSAKIVYLDGLLPKLRSEGHRCLIFSNFTSTLDLLQAYCGLRGYSYERLDGNCNRVERELSMLRFNAANSNCFVFLVTTTAGGVGVTLTGADTVILYDAHFNPQLDRQAADRAHRLGQTRPVHVYRLCLRHTVEEHIREVAARKASLGDFIVDGGRRSGAEDVRLTSEDIRAMLEQLESHRRERQASLVSPTTADLQMQRDMSISCSQRRAEDKVVEEILRVEANGLPGPSLRSGTDRQFGGRVAVTTHNCYVCGGIMHHLEPLYHCIVCPKAYHAQCVGERKPKLGEATKGNWSCPRHVCHSCGKPQAADGAIFMCVGCPRSFCFDCLDPRYLAMDEGGTGLLHVRRTYDTAEAEEVVPKRSCYYITCLRCCGVVSSSESDADVGSASDSGSTENGGSSSEGRRDDEAMTVTDSDDVETSTSG